MELYEACRCDKEDKVIKILESSDTINVLDKTIFSMAIKNKNTAICSILLKYYKKHNLSEDVNSFEHKIAKDKLRFFLDDILENVEHNDGLVTIIIDDITPNPFYDCLFVKKLMYGIKRIKNIDDDVYLMVSTLENIRGELWKQDEIETVEKCLKMLENHYYDPINLERERIIELLDSAEEITDHDKKLFWKTLTTKIQLNQSGILEKVEQSTNENYDIEILYKENPCFRHYLVNEILKYRRIKIIKMNPYEKLLNKLEID